MNLVLNVYTDDCLTELKKTVEADRLKIPYRVAVCVAQTLDESVLNDTDKIFNYIIGNLDKVDKIIKATFGLTDTEMECIDLMELGSVGVEIYKWAIDKINSLKGENEKNLTATA